MNIEHKYVSLASFKALEDGPGGFEGYLSKTGEIDDGGDLIVQGAYAETIDQFLSRGFTAESHDWAFSKMIGFPVSAQEDDTGLYWRSQFHSTPDAQSVRVKSQERMAAGLGVYMSIGYELAAPPVYIEPPDYAERIPEFSRKGMEQANLLKALQFPRVRVLPKINLFEGSIVSVPMLRSAEVTAVKGADVEGLGTGLPYSAHLKWLGTAFVEFMDRTDRVMEMDTKEGRVLSTANWDELTAIYERLGSLLESAKPKPKEDDTGKAMTPDDIRRMVARALVLRSTVMQGDYLDEQVRAVA